MRYSDLFQFEPIEDVIQLRTADQHDQARALVRTYVISERMADQLIAAVLPQLQLEHPQANKGVLIVGNYGTGKSHLMSVLSGIAEFPDLAQELSHAQVAEAAQVIAGRFKVARVEIGSVTGSLRDILVQELEKALEGWGTPFRFPADNQMSNNKDAIVEAVAAFQSKYPDTGILLVVDELLDFLRSREERQLILDLGFLRELGEVSATSPFRFLGGLQETLFDNPRFAFVAEQLRRVRDRFQQVRIAREDIAYVVSHRLLRKNDEQLASATEHLRRFAALYPRMAEQLAEFAQLFPVHPAYLEVFERVYVAEKREVLRTLSQAMRALLDQEVPADQPGLISYDQYWDVLRDNPSMRSLEGVAEVIKKSNVLEGQIRNAYTRPVLRPMAMRIIHALSVHRLTTGNIRAPLGATADELRDELCLYVRTPEETAQFLLDQVHVALREIMRTVSGQFISYSQENGQYYLDLEKVIDFEQKIAERGAAMDKSDLNRFFFDALGKTLNLSDSTYVTGHRIWFYELPWTERKVTRPGYLFLGAPDERSTAQPPRDFYIYFIPPFRSSLWPDGKRPDEVIFQLSGLDQAFEDLVRGYAGARSMAIESVEHRAVYAAKAEAQLGRVQRWLADALSDHLEVLYQGVREPIGKVLGRTRSSASTGVEDLLRLVASHLLTPQFEERYRDYPTFGRLREPVTEKARPEVALEAILALAGRRRTNLGLGVLDGLGLLGEDDAVRPAQSPFARRFLELLQSKPESQVVNREELIEVVAPGVEPVEKDVSFHLEPEWVAVVLLALVYNGDVVLNLGPQLALDAGSLDRAASMSLKDLTGFRFYSRPRDVPVNTWTQVFEGLGLAPGLIRDPNKREQAVVDLQRVVRAEQERLARLLDRVRPDLQLWNAPVFTDRYAIEEEGGNVVRSDRPAVTFSTLDLLPALRGYKEFLQNLAPFNTVGKLRNLRLSQEQVSEALGYRQVAERAVALLDLVAQLQPYTTYLAEAQANLLATHPWSLRARSERQTLLDQVRRAGKGEQTPSAPELTRGLEQLKKDYVAAYAELHRQLVLGPAADERRTRLAHDARLHALDALSAIPLLSGEELESWKDSLAGLRTCRGFHEGAIAETPTCPTCHLRPAQGAAGANAEQLVQQLDTRLDDLLARWRKALADNLSSEAARHSLEAMAARERKPIEKFLELSADTLEVPDGFVAAATQALRGIEAVTLSAEQLLEALKKGGLPCTPEELEARFAGFVKGAMRGHSPQNTRIKLDR